jgi:hypothetical protein
MIQMSSIVRQIKKNSEQFQLSEMYKIMTPEQYQKGIQIAIERTRKDLTEEFQRKYDKLVNEFNYNLKDGMGMAIDTISIELLYELAVQMNAFDEEDEEIRSQIIEKVQEIYENTMKAIEKYSKYKNDKQAQKEYTKRKNKVLKFFKLNIDYR